jgi:hypothetical protein
MVFYSEQYFFVNGKCIAHLSYCVINEMRTSSVSEGAKIKHINLRKPQNYTHAFREKPAKFFQFTVCFIEYMFLGSCFSFFFSDWPLHYMSFLNLRLITRFGSTFVLIEVSVPRQTSERCVFERLKYCLKWR